MGIFQSDPVVDMGYSLISEILYHIGAKSSLFLYAAGNVLKLGP